MKKVILIIGSCLLLCGCGSIIKENPYSHDGFYVDNDTCVEYFVSDGAYNKGNITPRYNADGTLKQNEQCLLDKEK